MAYDPSINYMEEINKLRAVNPNDPRIRELEIARQEKIAGDFGKYGQYANPITDPYGNAYVVNMSTGGYATIGRTPQGTYALGPNQRFATQFEAEEYAKNIPGFQNEITNRINQLAEAQRQSRIASLSKAKESALSRLASEESGIKPMYYDMRNRTAASSDVGARNFAEFMAARGIKGSAGAMPEIYRNTALQGQIGAINRQEAADIADIARRRSDIESAYQYDVAAAMADIESQSMQAYINALREAQAQRIADLAAQGKTSTGELTLQGKSAQDAELARRASLLAAQYYDNIQGYINTLNPNDPIIPYLYAERQKKIQTQAEQAAQQAAMEGEATQLQWQNAFNLFKATGRITSPEQARILGLPTNATVADVDIARMNAATSRMNAETARMNAEKKGNDSGSGTIGGTFGVNAVYNDAKNLRDNGADSIEIIDYVINSGLSEGDIAATLSRLGYTNADINEYERITGPSYFGDFRKLDR